MENFHGVGLMAGVARGAYPPALARASSYPTRHPARAWLRYRARA